MGAGGRGEACQPGETSAWMCILRRIRIIHRQSFA